MASAKTRGSSTKIMQNVQVILGRKAKGAVAGLFRVGLKIQRQAQEWVPVEYGDLRSSAYTKKVETQRGSTVVVGFAAKHAIFVHENTEMKLAGLPRRSGIGVYWGPHGRPRFLAEAVEVHRAEIAAEAAKDARKAK